MKIYFSSQFFGLYFSVICAKDSSGSSRCFTEIGTIADSLLERPKNKKPRQLALSRLYYFGKYFIQLKFSHGFQGLRLLRH